MTTTRLQGSSTSPLSTPAVPNRKVQGTFRLLAALYISQAIPLGFFIEAVPAIGRSLGLSLSTIGMVQVLALPFLIKFLWAPVIDAYGSPRIGHYRSWLLPLQTLSVMAVFALAWLDPKSQPWLLLVVGGIFLVLASTQDIATDGLAIRLLQPGNRGIGNGIQVGGYYLGQILGGGLMLILLSHYGWRRALCAMALLMAIPLLPVVGFREPARIPTQGGNAPTRKVDFAALGRFFQQPGHRIWVAILILYRAGDAMAVTMAKPLMVDLGLSLAQIGLIIGLGSSICALAGALTGGSLVGRLGHRRALITFALLQSLAILGYLLPAQGFDSLGIIWGVAMTTAFAGGVATTALYTHMMDASSARSGGTDFTLQQSLAVLGPLVGASLSGLLAQAIGYSWHFVGCSAVGVASAALVFFCLKERPTRDRVA
ncbi:MAG: MFS transporter [Deltaproteobacteria bacterium]|nr:MFS transporter [Deltaproteobacteria bacterium]